MKLNLRVSALLAVAAIFALGAVGASLHNLRRLHQSLEWVRHTNDVLRALASAEIGLLSAESGERGYVLSGDPSYLESYRRGAADAVRAFDALAELVADNPVQAQRIQELRAAADTRLEEFREVIGLGPSRREDALELLVAVRVRQRGELVRGMLTQARAEERALLDERQRGFDLVAQEMTGLSAAMTILAVLSTAFGAYLLQRQQALARLHAANAQANALQAELLHVSRLSNMGEMASALAHELNQPLAAVTSYVQGSRRLLRGLTDEKAAMASDALAKAAEQTLRAGAIIRRLREFVARGESEKRVESLSRIADETITLARVATKDVSARIETEIDPEADSILVDKVQIQQVLLNLVRNGIEAMRDCDRRELDIRARLAPGGMVTVEVADSGSGLPPEISGRLFQPFTSTKSHGLGVGLSISRTIVEAHGGRIEARSNPGGGTIFRFTLPAAREQPEDQPAAAT